MYRCAATRLGGCRRGRGRRRQWPSCPTHHPPRRLTTTTSAPTTGCWRRCTSSTRPIPARSTRPGLRTSRPTARRAPATVGRSRPLRSPAGRHRRRPEKGAEPAGPGRAHEPTPTRARTGAGARAGRAGCGEAARARISHRRRARPRRGAIPPSRRPAQINESRPATPGARGGVPADPPNPADRPSVSLEEPVKTVLRGAPARTAKNMDISLSVPDRDQRPLAAGEAADRPASGDQQPSAPGPGRQGLLHPPHRLSRWCRRSRPTRR